MKVAMVTVMAMTHGLARGRQVSWNEGVAAEASADPFDGCCSAMAVERLVLNSVASSE
jgi:hypothetical protein